jgi:hypothetical protein
VVWSLGPSFAGVSYELLVRYACYMPSHFYTYWYTYLLSPWLCGPLRDFASLITDGRSSLLTLTPVDPFQHQLSHSRSSHSFSFVRSTLEYLLIDVFDQIVGLLCEANELWTFSLRNFSTLFLFFGGATAVIQCRGSLRIIIRQSVLQFNKWSYIASSRYHMANAHVLIDEAGRK